MLDRINTALAESERHLRRSADIDRKIKSLLDRSPPSERSFDDLAHDLKVELRVVGHHALLMIGIALSYALLFMVLIWVFPYVWNWFWSFP